MRQLTDYVLGIGAQGTPGMSGQRKTVDLRVGGCQHAADPIPLVLGAIARSGLTSGDFRARVIFLANDDHGGARESLLVYAALCGLAGRRVDAYAGGRVLEFSQPDQREFLDDGRPLTYLEWAQIGGPSAEGMPSVALQRLGPAEISVIRYAARVRLVAPASTKDALEAFVLVAGIRRRARDRFPYLSTGDEPAPVGKDDPRQGIDLEQMRMATEQHRKEQRRSAGRETTVVASATVPRRLRRIAEANATDIRSILTRLGCVMAESGRWFCPRAGGHPIPDERPTIRVTGDNRARCHQCDQDNLTPVRLVVETLALTPDEAVSFVTGEDSPVEVGATVTAHVLAVAADGFTCTVMDADRVHDALLSPVEHGELPAGVVATQWAPGDTVTALVTGVRPAPDRRLDLSVTAPGLIDRILGVFVDELCTGQVVITAVARVVGSRTKIVVAPTQPNLDARRAFLGRGANRVLAAKRLLNRSHGREQLEIIEYAQDRRTYLRNAMNPMRVTDLLIRDGHAVVAVDEHLRSGGIGEGGLNAQLAGRLTGLYVWVVPTGTDLKATLDELIAERAGERV